MTSAACTSAGRVRADGVATDTAGARVAPGHSGCPTSEKRSAAATGTDLSIIERSRTSASSGLTRIAAISSSTAREHGPSASTAGDQQRCHPGQNSRCATAATVIVIRLLTTSAEPSGKPSVIGIRCVTAASTDDHGQNIIGLNDKFC
jgi:hypothetical protein